MGDKMTLIYIEDTNYLKKIIYLFKKSEISFTTNLNDNFDSILISELNNRTLNLVKKYYLNKRIIFWFHLEEIRFCYNYTKQNKSSLLYKNKLFEILSLCTDIVVSLPFFKNLFEKKLRKSIYVIPRINKKIFSIKTRGLCKKYNLAKNMKKILVIDYNYQYLEWIYSLASNYKKIQFIYIDYTPEFRLTNRKQQLLKNKPSNIKIETIFFEDIFLELLSLSDMVIYLSDLYDYNYLSSVLLMKKIVFVKNFYAFESFLVNSKNCYIFDSSNELNKKVGKILNNRISNLSEKGYELVKNNNTSQIVYMLNQYFKK